MEKKPSNLPMIIIIAVGLLLAIASYELMETHWRGEQIRQFQDVAQEQSYLAQNAIEDVFNSLAALRTFYDASDQVTEREFNLYSQYFLNRYDGINSFFWIANQSTRWPIMFMTGMQQSGLIQGVDLTKIPALTHLRDQQHSTQFTLFPLSMLDKQMAVKKGNYVLLLPIYKNQQLTGYIGEVFNLPLLLQGIHSGLELKSNIELSIQDAVYLIYHDHVDAQIMTVYQRSFGLGGYTWNYRQDLVKTPLSFSILLLGFMVFFSVLIGSSLLALYLYTKRNQHFLTEKLVKSRTHELHLATARLKQRSLQLTKANAELQQFAYVASHDLQEPLRMISSYSQLIHERDLLKDDKEAKEFLHYILDAAKRLQQLIQGLLQYSRIEYVKLNRTSVDLNDIVTIVKQDLHDRIVEKNAVIQCNALPIVYGDQTQLTRLFQNLISNALKYVASSEIPHITINAVKQADEWVVSIKDNGIGIESSQFERIFEVFQRLHTQADYEGTGIGLSICQRIVERHGGHIWVESSVDQGTTFFFSLPTGEHEVIDDASRA